MNRQIEFRAFYDNRMHDNCEAMRILYNNSTENSLTPKYPIMQFTGLTDKNGTKVYEGDIIKDLITSALMQVKFGHNKNHAYNGWYLEYIGISVRDTPINGDYDTTQNNNIVVIGNLHEHPHLLTQQK
jgi:uncharacterized phage protein (TIGR01671 family)